MSIETETNTESTKVVEDAKPHTGTPDQPLTKEQRLENDNWQQREKLRLYKEEVETLKGTVQTLTSGLTEIQTSLAAKQEAETQAAKEKALNSALDEAGIVDAKARTLATKMLGDAEDLAAGIKQVIEDYPFIVGKKTIVLPNTGVARSDDTHIPVEQKLASGLSKIINK